MTGSLTRPEAREVHGWLRDFQGFTAERGPMGTPRADWSRKGRVRVVTDEGWVYVYVFEAGSHGYSFTLKTDGPWAAIQGLVTLALGIVAAEAIPAE